MPQVNYQRDVAPYDQDPGTWTDEEIAQNIGGETYQSISLQQARAYHFDADWWLNSEEGIYEGAFQMIRDDPGAPPIAEDVLKRVWQIIFGIGQPTFNTELRRKTNGQIAKNQFGHYFRSFTEWAVTDGRIEQADVDEFIQIGSGWKYPEKPTAADVTASRSSDDEQQARDTAVAEVNSKAGQAMAAANEANSQGQTPQEILDAAEAAWNA